MLWYVLKPIIMVTISFSHPRQPFWGHLGWPPRPKFAKLTIRSNCSKVFWNLIFRLQSVFLLTTASTTAILRSSGTTSEAKKCKVQLKGPYGYQLLKVPLMTETDCDRNILFQSTLEHRNWYPYWPLSQIWTFWPQRLSQMNSKLLYWMTETDCYLNIRFLNTLEHRNLYPYWPFWQLCIVWPWRSSQMTSKWLPWMTETDCNHCNRFQNIL